MSALVSTYIGTSVDIYQHNCRRLSAIVFSRHFNFLSVEMEREGGPCLLMNF
ncbi:hypothetical protein M2101_000759 [Parabacteroides sp. PM5-20]|nr:hypothetical protein [Parabacteroides sp. PM5-20]